MAKENFIQQLFSSLFSGSGPDAEKKKQLRAIAKRLNKSKYKYYKTSSNEVLPTFAKLFYDIYKVISSSQILFRNINNPNLYKLWIMDFCMTESQRDLANHFTEEYITELSKQMPVAQIKETIKKEWGVFSSEFDANKIQTIDDIYNLFLLFVDFCNFDYYFLLKKFSSKLREQDFSVVPTFETIRAEYIIEDIKEFISIAWLLSFNAQDWTKVFEIIKNNKNVIPVQQNIWNKLIILSYRGIKFQVLPTTISLRSLNTTIMNSTGKQKKTMNYCLILITTEMMCKVLHFD